VNDGKESIDVSFPTEPGAAAIIDLAEKKITSIKVVIGEGATDVMGLSEIVVIGE
jgi:hypothetical protein